MFFRLFLFVLILALGYALETWDLEHTHFQEPWNTVLAFLAEQGIQFFHGSVKRLGNQLTDPGTGKTIVVLAGCNGFEVTFMLLTAVGVYPSCFRAKLIGMLVGFLAVQSLNVLRVACLYYLNLWDEEMFRIAHLYVWQSLIMLDVLVILMLWLRWQHSLCIKA